MPWRAGDLEDGLARARLDFLAVEAELDRFALSVRLLIASIPFDAASLRTWRVSRRQDESSPLATFETPTFVALSHHSFKGCAKSSRKYLNTLSSGLGAA